ncbi:hypothetical protein ACHAXS_003176 [Conticribra weissflogii]
MLESYIFLQDCITRAKNRVLNLYNISGKRVGLQNSLEFHQIRLASYTMTAPSSSWKPIFWIIDVAIAVYTIGFLFFRIGELVPLLSIYPTQSRAAFLGTCVLHTSSPVSRASKRLFCVSSILILIYVMDSYAPTPVPSVSYVKAAEGPKTIVITGANSGVGFETSRQLAVTYGLDVIMACRSKAKCAKASDTINAEIASSKSPSGGTATPHTLDLANFDSVASFANQITEMKPPIDVLFNNAGFVPDPKLPVNEYGLDPGFTPMHLSHFLLAELLLKSNPSMRVVNTSSGTHHFCAIPYAFVPKPLLKFFTYQQNPGCVDEDFLQNGIRSETDNAAYIQSKVANVMHASEIPRAHEQSTAVAIDLGWVGTSIQSFMTGSLTPASVGWMRSASVGVLPVLHAILTKKEDLMNSLGRKGGWAEGGIIVNVYGRVEEPFSASHWTSKGISGYDVGKERMKYLGGLLWRTSREIFEERGLL